MKVTVNPIKNSGIQRNTTEIPTKQSRSNLSIQLMRDYDNKSLYEIFMVKKFHEIMRSNSKNKESEVIKLYKGEEVTENYLAYFNLLPNEKLFIYRLYYKSVDYYLFSEYELKATYASMLRMLHLSNISYRISDIPIGIDKKIPLPTVCDIKIDRWAWGDGDWLLYELDKPKEDK